MCYIMIINCFVNIKKKYSRQKNQAQKKLYSTYINNRDNVAHFALTPQQIIFIYVCIINVTFIRT